MIARALLFAAACLAVAGCGQKPNRTADKRAAEGEVLGGTISDSMLPLGTVTSTSPADAGADEHKPTVANEPDASPTAKASTPALGPSPTASPSAAKTATPSPSDSPEPGQ